MKEGLVLEAVGVQRGHTQIIQSVSANIGRGQIAALIGPNGTGKSTLLGAIAGHLAFTGGIKWNGRRPEAGRIGFMPQYCTVQSSLSVLEVLLLGRREKLGWQVGRRDLDAAAGMLDSFDLHAVATRAMNTLSGGQQQLVLLAQRLMREPELLILDEATSALDLRHQMRVLELLSDYVAKTGALVLMAMHDLNLAARHAQNLLLLEKGRLVACGTHEVVLSRDNIRDTYRIEANIVFSDGFPVIVPVGSL